MHLLVTYECIIFKIKSKSSWKELAPKTLVIISYLLF